MVGWIATTGVMYVGTTTKGHRVTEFLMGASRDDSAKAPCVAFPGGRWGGVVVEGGRGDSPSSGGGEDRGPGMGEVRTYETIFVLGPDVEGG